MAKVGELFISLRASTASFSKDLKNSTRLTSKSAKQMEAAFKKVGLALVALGAAAVAGLGLLIKNSIKTADQMNKMAQSVGLSTEKLSGLAFAAQLSDVNLEELGARLTNLNRRAKEGARGVLSYKLAFDKLGISLTGRNLNLKGTEELLLEIADAFAGMEDGTLKSALATDIFSNAGVKLIPFLNQGRKGIKALTDEAERLGLVIDTKTAVAAEEFNDNLTRLSSAMTGLGNTVAATLLPIFARLTDKFVVFVKEGDKIKGIAKEIAVAFLALALSINDMKTRLTTTTDAVANATDVFLEFLRAPITGLDPVRAAWKKLFDDAEVTALKGEDAARRLVEAFFSLSQDIKAPAKEVELSLEGVSKKIEELIKKNKDLSQHAIQPVIFDFDDLKLSTQELREAQEKQNAETAAATEFLRAHGVELNRTIELTDDAAKIGETFTDSLGSGLQNLIIRGGKFSDVLKGIAQDLAAMLARLAILRLIGGIVGGLFGGGASSSGGGSAKPFQHGGTIRAGQVGIVGEGGEPEIIAAGVTSTITPLSKLGGTTIIINAQGAQAGVGAEIRRALRQAQKETAALARMQIRENSLRSA